MSEPKWALKKKGLNQNFQVPTPNPLGPAPTLLRWRTGRWSRELEVIGAWNMKAEGELKGEFWNDLEIWGSSHLECHLVSQIMWLLQAFISFLCCRISSLGISKRTGGVHWADKCVEKKKNPENPKKIKKHPGMKKNVRGPKKQFSLKRQKFWGSRMLQVYIWQPFVEQTNTQKL